MEKVAATIIMAMALFLLLCVVVPLLYDLFRYNNLVYHEIRMRERYLPEGDDMNGKQSAESDCATDGEHQKTEA